MSIRTERVASLIREEIGALLVREYRDPSMGFTTVTEVTMTPDLKIAKVYLSILGSAEVRERTMERFKEEKSHIRGLVGSHLRLKFTPSLQFYLDETMDRVDRINNLIKKIHTDGSNGPHGSSS